MCQTRKVTEVRDTDAASCAYCSTVSAMSDAELCAACEIQARQEKIVFREGKGWVCRRCDGRGWFWYTPPDFNPFIKGIRDVSSAMRRAKCSCKHATEKPSESAMDRALRAIAETARAA